LELSNKRKESQYISNPGFFHRKNLFARLLPEIDLDLNLYLPRGFTQSPQEA